MKKLIFDPRSTIYVLVHLVMLLLGLLLAAQDEGLLPQVGLALVGAGVVGYVTFAYVLVSRRVGDRLDLFASFGLEGAFEGRATKIQGEYEKRVRKAKSGIDVIAFGLSSMLEDLGGQFPAWKARAPVRILLIDPDYPSQEHSFADERDREEAREIGRIRGDVERFVAQTREHWDDRFKVRLYRCIPAVNIFRVDDEIFWGPYLMKEQGRNTPTLLVRKGPVYDTLIAHFDAIWNEHSVDPPLASEQ